MNSPVWGATSQLISYQGKLTDPNSLSLNGDYILSFSIYSEETGGDPLWTESQSARVVNGIYNVRLGAVEPLNAEIANHDSLYLEVKIGDDIMSPRLPVTSSVFAFRAGEAGNTDALDGYDSSDFALSDHIHSFTELADTATDNQIPDDITIEYAAKAGDAVTFAGRDPAEFLNTSANRYRQNQED